MSVFGVIAALSACRQVAETAGLAHVADEAGVLHDGLAAAPEDADLATACLDCARLMVARMACWPEIDAAGQARMVALYEALTPARSA